MTELQEKLLEMLTWLHNFIIKHDLRYYALGGTMLGAVRHQGFIPWDDDIDIGMPRKDYNKLIDLIGDKLYEGFYLETPYSKNKEYKYPYCKLYNTKTILIEDTWPRLKRGIFIDIFPLDGLGNSEDRAIKKAKAITSRANFLWCRTCAIRRERALYKNIAISIAHMVPSIFVNEKKMILKMEQDCQEFDFDVAPIGGNVFGNWGTKEIMPSSIMGIPKLYNFEGLTIYGASNAHAYLSRLYGDWKQLPPIEKRISHHDFFEIDLSKEFM